MHRPRELRRRVMVPARLRQGSAWCDACILNVSSRGLMIRTGRSIAPGTTVEIRRGDCAIVARVIWGEQGRAGLQAEDRLPIEEILTIGQSPALQLTAKGSERRKAPRAVDRSRQAGRAIEFAGLVVAAASLAGAGLMMVEQAFARPLAVVSASLSQ